MRNNVYFDAAEMVTQYLKKSSHIGKHLIRKLSQRNIDVGLEATLSLLRANVFSWLQLKC